MAITFGNLEVKEQLNRFYKQGIANGLLPAHARQYAADQLKAPLQRIVDSWFDDLINEEEDQRRSKARFKECWGGGTDRWCPQHGYAQCPEVTHASQ